MNTYSKTFEIIWADIDPNRHLRHTAYNNYAAQARISIFAAHGWPVDKIAKAGLGPILFREETKFLKEVGLSEIITVTCQVKAMRKDTSKWTIIHEIFKKENVKAAEIIVEGAWIDLEERKIGIPPTQMQKAIHQFPRTDDFRWIADKVKN